MQKNKTIYGSSIDSIVALAKRLNRYEEKYHLSSEDFFDKFKKGQLDDSIDHVEWSNDYQNFLSLKLELEKRLEHVA